MTVTYESGTGLYINITNRCTNRCEFCVRTSKDGYYGDLWLEREPTADEIVESVLSRDLSAYSEIVFCGYGEPFCRAEVLIASAKRIKEKTDLPIRVNTNGHAELICGEDIAPRLNGVVDSISVSLNAPNAQRYDEICHSVYGQDAFAALLDFAVKCKNQVPYVSLSIVDKDLSQEDILECKRIANDLDLKLKIRKYIN